MDIRAHQQKKRKLLLPRVRIFVVVSFGCAALLWGFFWIPYFRISALKTNDPLVADAVLTNAFAGVFAAKNKLFLPKNNIFLFSPSDAERMLREQGIGIAAVKKHFPGTIVIEFESTEPKFIFCPDALCYYVNQSGVLSERAPIFSDNPLPLLIAQQKNPVLGDQIISKRAANFLTIFQKGIAALRTSVIKIESEKSSEAATGSIVLTMRGESDRAHTWQLLISDSSDPEKLVRDLGLLLREKIKNNIEKLEYVDFRFPDKAFFKLN